jgi:eukaryotic-like serine/threonine-protein kinase
MAHPAKLGRYEILQPLGQGAMGCVYEARDPVIDRTVAVKTVGSLLLGSQAAEEFLERFRREARAAGRLSHPNVVPVHDMGVDEATGTPFIVMEYVDGVSLATVLKENPVLPLPQALELLEQVAAALDEAHRSGIVHRDVKPGNVFLDTRGRVKVGDFGIARLPESDLTETGVRLGTPGYLPPEVLQGEKADARGDVFALGALAYQVLTGRRPFEGPTREAIAVQVLQSDPAEPRTLRPDLPAPVSELVMRALRRDPKGRPPHAGAFLEGLRATRPGPQPTLTTAAAVPAPRRRLLPWLAIAARLAAALCAAAFLVLKGPPGEATRAAPAGASAAPRATATPAPAPARPTARPALDETPRQERDGEGPGKGRGHGRGHGKKKKND